MAFAKKLKLLEDLRPDIAVVPESSKKDTEACKSLEYDTRWWGDHENKGLGILAKKPWALVDEGGRTGKLLAPVRVVGPLNFLLIGVWAGAIRGNRKESYPKQIFDALKGHPEWFCRGTSRSVRRL
jgi:hypothetical protein